MAKQKMGDASLGRVLPALIGSVRLEARSLIFWLVALLVIGISLFVIVNANAIFASTPEIEENITVGDEGSGSVISVEINRQGAVLVDGQKMNRIFYPLPQTDELRFKVVDKPGYTIGGLTVTVRFADSLPPETKIKSLAVHGITEASERQIDDQTLQYTAFDLGPEATYTIVAQLPKGMIDWSLSRQIIGWSIGFSPAFWLGLSFSLPLLTFIILMIMFGPNLLVSLRSPKVALPTAPPVNLPPGIINILVNGRVSSRALAATLLDLANRGYISIFRKGEGDFVFAKRSAWRGVAPFELILLNQLFASQHYKAETDDIQLSVGENLFSKPIAQAYLSLYDAASRTGYFHHNPAQIHRRYQIAGLILFFLGLGVFGIGLAFEIQPNFSLFLFAGVILMALVIILAAPMIPVLTPQGEQARQQWLAFRRYLADPSPINYTDGAQDHYEKYLPYAIVLNQEVAWANRFREHPFAVPVWYDSTEKTIAIEDFANGLYSIVGAVAKLFASAKEPTVQ